MSKRKGASTKSRSGAPQKSQKPKATAAPSPSPAPAQPAAPASGAGADLSTYARARERQAERRQQQRRQQQLAIAASFAAVALIALVLIIIINQPAEAPIPSLAEARYENLVASTTERGYPRLGQTLNTVRVVEYSSFSCPACRAFHDEVFPTLLQRVERGEISFSFVPLLTGSIPNAEGAARAALCAGEQGKFWPYHDALFAWHGLYGNQAFSQNRLLTGIRELVLDVDAYNACLNSPRIGQIIDAAQREAQEALTTVETPAITIDGVAYAASLDTINRAIDQRLLARGIVPGANAAQPTTPEVTREVAPTLAPEATDEADPRPTRTPSN
jgi:protein-disulfide isomerase